MVQYAAGIIIAFILGLILPHPFGLAVVAGVALGGIFRLGDRVARLESVVRDRLGIDDDGPYRGGDGYASERERIRAQLKRYEEQKKEERG